MAEVAIDETDFVDTVYDADNVERPPWKFCNSITLPRSEVVYFTQVLVVLMILIASLTKLIVTDLPCEEQNIWFSLLSGVVGYILPNPKL